MFTRFNGNVVPFADDATSTNRTVFGGVTQSDAIDDNLNADFKKGWEIVGLNDNPTREDFNAMGYTLGALISYLYEMGISEWNTLQNYRVNSIVIGSDGNLYKSLTGTSGTPNAGNNPLSDVINWKSLEAVSLTGNQTIAGIKTFTSSPVVPIPTTNTQATNKQYVDDTISNIQILPIGAILNGYTIFNNCIVAFGGEFNRADYPKLWAYLQSNPSLVKTQAEWTTKNTTNGMCGYFSDGDGTTTFRVPNLDKAFLRPDSRTVGSYQGDAIRNITGNMGGVFSSYPIDGAIKMTSGILRNIASAPNYENASVSFDASRVVPTADENRPKNIAVLPLIVAK